MANDAERDVAIVPGPAGPTRGGVSKVLDAIWVEPGVTYRYRDPAGRRAYMRDYMRAYRARKKSSGVAAVVG